MINELLDAARSRLPVLKAKKQEARKKFNLILDSEVLSYLSYAELCSLNMLVCVENSIETEVFSLLCSLLPRYGIIAILANAPDEVEINTMVKAVIFDLRLLNRNKALKQAIEMNPVKIISEVQLEPLSELFAYASTGGGFISTVVGYYDEKSIVKALLSNKFKVKIDDLNMLDIFILVKVIDDEIVMNVYEYRWLSRAETTRGVVVRDSDVFEVTEIVHHGKMTGAKPKLSSEAKFDEKMSFTTDSI